MKARLIRIWRWLKLDLDGLRNTEPAKLNAWYVQVVVVLAAAGITIPDIVDRRVGAGIAVAGIVLPWLQGKKTRADVFSPQTVRDLGDLTALFPSQAAEIERCLAHGWSKWETYLHVDRLINDPQRVSGQAA